MNHKQQGNRESNTTNNNAPGDGDETKASVVDERQEREVQVRLLAVRHHVHEALQLVAGGLRFRNEKMVKKKKRERERKKKNRQFFV
jgi:hypothetical protein